MFRVWESIGRDQEYTELYQRLLPELDLILWVVKADDRALAIDQQVFNSVIRPYLADRDIPVLFVISQVDKVAPCWEWDHDRHLPSSSQQSNLSRKQIQLSQTFDIALDHICVTSAEEGYGLTSLVEQIVTLLPNQKSGRLPGKPSLSTCQVRLTRRQAKDCGKPSRKLPPPSCGKAGQ
jgi:predicted GTPase